MTISWAWPCLPPEVLQLGEAHHSIVHSPTLTQVWICTKYRGTKAGGAMVGYGTFQELLTANEHGFTNWIVDSIYFLFLSHNLYILFVK